MRKLTAAALLLLCGLCAAFAQAASLSPLQLLSAQEQHLEMHSQEATLYFRYLNSGYLGRESREVSYPRSGSREKAIVAALIEGPGSLSASLNPLFPPGTQVLSVISEGERLFVTFNEALMGRYSDEPLISQEDYRRGEGQLRRRLAMASLVNSLTEGGQFSSVQVLVRGETYVADSMRLSQRYYLEDGNALPPPLLRQEQYILGPQAAAGIFMEAWQSMSWQQGLRLVRGSGEGSIPSEQELRQMVDRAPRLIEYSVTPGVVALNGQSAVVCLSYRLLNQDGQERLIELKPLRLAINRGMYSIAYDDLLRLLELAP